MYLSKKDRRIRTLKPEIVLKTLEKSTNKRQPGKNENDERVGDDCDEGEQRPDDSEQG